jgi:hypothetical protein
MSMSDKISELTTTLLMIALVLVPVGLVTMASVNTSGLGTATVVALGSIGIIVVASVVIAIMKGMGKD